MIKGIRQLFLYLVVGGIATVVEWVAFWFLDRWMHYLAATALAFVISTLANWLAGRFIMFKNAGQTVAKEVAQIYATSICGLLFNFLIMWIAIDGAGLPDMISKIIATGIVFFWNFLVRKYLIYKV